MSADPGSTRRPSSTRTRERARGRRSERTRARHSASTGIRISGLDGRYNLRVIVTDVAGNSTTSSTVTNRKIQNLPPLVDITSPGNYINAASPSPFTITVTTEALQFGVDHVEFFRCTDASVNCSTGTFASIGVDFTDPYTASWAQASEPEGNRALNALVVDGDGGTGAGRLQRDHRPDCADRLDHRSRFRGVRRRDDGRRLLGLGGHALRRHQVVFQRSPAGQGTWTALATDTTQPVLARLEHDVALGRRLRLARSHDRHGRQLVQRPGDDGQRRQHGPDARPRTTRARTSAPTVDADRIGLRSGGHRLRSPSSARRPARHAGRRSTPTRPRPTR